MPATLACVQPVIKYIMSTMNQSVNVESSMLRSNINVEFNVEVLIACQNEPLKKDSSSIMPNFGKDNQYIGAKKIFGCCMRPKKARKCKTEMHWKMQSKFLQIFAFS